MAGNVQVLEGFICPICMLDFKAPDQLLKHFEECHNDDSEFLKCFKGIDQFYIFFFIYNTCTIHFIRN